LKALRKLTDVPLVQLMDERGAPYDFTKSGDKRTYADMITSAGLAEIATYAQGIGPGKGLLIPRNPDNSLGKPTRLVEDAHRAGLQVHPWTFRSENFFLPSDLRQGSDVRRAGTYTAEYAQFLALGIDGLFSDYPAHAVVARAAMP
jgi:glycerophosphoryl diester phosphodiesterase